MDRNNPVWREYLKAVIRIQIDAGVDGIQLDEAELPLGAMQYGACFCTDCMKGFRRIPAGAGRRAICRPSWSESTWTTFQYGPWLLGQRLRLLERQSESPLFGALLRLSVPGRSPSTSPSWPITPATYGRSLGRDVLVSGNFFNLDPHYLPLAERGRPDHHRDAQHHLPAAGVVPLRRSLRRYVDRSEVVVVENPYGGVVPEIVDALARGTGSRPDAAQSVGGSRVRREHDGAVRLLDGRDDAGLVLGAARSAGGEPVLRRRRPSDLRSPDQRPTRWRWSTACRACASRMNRADAGDNLSNAHDESVMVPYRGRHRDLSRAGCRSMW